MFTAQHKTIIRFEVIVFLFKSLNVLLAATKNVRSNYIFFVKPTCFLLIRETRKQWQFFKSTLIISDKPFLLYKL